jgi:dephospho-CoA kinase
LGVLRVAVVGPSERDAADVAATWRRLARTATISVEETGWPVDAATASRHHLVIGVADGAPPVIDSVDCWIRPTGAVSLWGDRLAPFAANLAAVRRARRRRVAVLAAPDRTWPAQAARLIGRLRHAFDDRVLRIDHIGSTSVPGLPAKDLVDIQVVVRDLATARDVATRADVAGLVRVVGDWTAPDRLGMRFREEALVDADPGRPTNVNLRPVTDPVWRETLLFRDWLRADARHRDAYLAEKRRLTASTEHVDDYGDGKLEWIGAALGRATTWATAVGWEP